MKTAILMKLLMANIPKGMFGNTPFKINTDGSVTFDYPDVGSFTKIFVANEEYFNWLKSQSAIADKVPSFIKDSIFPSFDKPVEKPSPQIDEEKPEEALPVKEETTQEIPF